MSPPARVAIVGAGLLGLTMAWRLMRLGYDVVVYESEEQCGGLAQPCQVGNITWDRFYHVILLSDQELRSLFAELGIEQDIIWKESRSGFFGGGKLVPLSGPIDYLRLPTMSLWAKLRLASSLVYASRVRSWRALEAISAEAWLRRISGNEAWSKLWIPLLRAKLGDNYRKVSAAFIWAVINRLVKARRLGYRRDLFGCVAGGYSKVLDVFTSKLRAGGVQIFTNTAVRHIEHDGKEHSKTIVSLSSGKQEAFDRVVVTLAPPLARSIIPQLSLPERTALDQIQYQGLICPAMLLKSPLAGYYLTYITDERVPFTSVIEMSALVDRAQFGGKTLVYLPCYVDPQSGMFERSEEEIRQEFIDGMKVIFPKFDSDEIIAWRMSRVRHVFAITTENYSRYAPGFQTTVKGVYLVNSAQIVNGTLNVNESVQLANRAVEEIFLVRPTQGDNK